jgi:hypothetical protein
MAKQPKTEGERSEPAYPYYPWKTCLETAAAVQRAGGARSDVSRNMLAHELQMDADMPALTQRIAAARAFGMIEGRGAYRLTDIAKRYFFPTSPDEARQAELGFFAFPRTFSALIARFDGNTLPAPASLANILLQQSVPPSWKDRVAGIFKDAAEQLRIVDGAGRLRYMVAVHGAKIIDQPASDTTGGIGKPINQVHETDTAMPITPIGGSRQQSNVWVYTEGGGTVRLETPNPLPRALWDRLTKYVEMLEPAKPENGVTNESN